MSLSYIEYLIPLLLLLLIFGYYINKKENNFYRWIEDYWFYKRTKRSKLSSVLFLIGISLLVLSILDLRGPEENIEAKVAKQETMILIDSSASMLSEDVRPNRFKKAIFLAKHYVKKAVGQYISVTVFSDSQKRIIPFTNDTDLLEARLSGLENLDLKRGGTGLKLALQESIQHFRTKGSEVKGNILIISDAENNSEFGVVNIQDDVNIAVIGVGTLKGGTIPIRDKKGSFKGSKKYKGKEVITKLDESFLRELGKKIKNYKYWTASSYSLPTDKVLSFFRAKNAKQEKKDKVRIRPVLSNYIMIPAVIILTLSFLLKNFKSFVLPLLLLVNFSAYSQVEVKKELKEEKRKKSYMVQELERKFKQGTISTLEKRKLANELLKEKFPVESSMLYKELIEDEINDENKNDYFNLGASELLNKKNKEGLKIYKDLYEYLKKNESNSKLFEDTKKNMLKALKQQQQQKKQKQKQKEQDEKKKKDQKKKKGDKEKKDGKKKKEGKDGKEGKEGDKSEKSGKPKDAGKDSKDGQEDKKDKKKDSKDKDKNKDKEKNQKNKDKKDSKSKSGKKMSKKKLPALLKQLMNDDNQLQRKVIDAATNKRGSGDRKDW